MTIDYSRQRWKGIKENYRLWWTGQLDRPLIQLTLIGRNPGRDEPELPGYDFQSFYDLSVPAETIVDRWDYELSCLEFLGDAFPSRWLNFGPGVTAAFLGAKLVNRMDEGTVWFEPPEILAPGDLHFEYSNDSVWLKRIKDICRAAIQRWDGLVQVGATDLGGVLDILSVFRPEGRLLLDLYDHPDEIKRLIWELHDLWFMYFDEINQVLQPTNPGYSSWATVYSEQPHYMLQSDFCYMISPEMFDEFVKPELIASCEKLANPFYHMDGLGQLNKLDSLLSIEKLKGIQWIPGVGQPGPLEWIEVYRKIHETGKRNHLLDSSGYAVKFDTLNAVLDQLGSGRSTVTAIQVPISQKKEAIEFLKKHSVV